MRILITGANGFIAKEIIAKLNAEGHHITACVQGTYLPNTPVDRVIHVNFNEALTEAHWLTHLENIDVVINCVGVFQTVSSKIMWQIHYEAPKALFAACEKKQITKIIQISALGIDQVDVDYANSKLALEEFLSHLNIASTIIRPGLVYGKGSYGGSSLFRGLAGFPFFIFLPGSGTQLQQPIHVDDLTRIVSQAIHLSHQQLFTAVGAEKLSVKEVLIKLRAWLGFKKAICIVVPNFLIKLVAKFGNLIPNSPISDTGVKMMTVDNTTTPEKFDQLVALTGVHPRGFSQGLNGMVSSVQDRWHAKLYFLRPLLRLSLAFIWIFSGVISLLPENASFAEHALMAARVPPDQTSFILYILSGWDIVLGLMTLFNYRLILAGVLQCLSMIAYTIALAIVTPGLLIHPYTPLAKNLPLLVATFIMIALESDR